MHTNLHTNLRRFALIICLIGFAIFPAHAADKIGIVLMHGKQGHPDRLSSLAGALSSAGYLIDTPEMCWSRNRGYDRPYLDCLSQINASISRLKSRGATAIVVAGHSLGGNAALGYAARNNGLKGVIALAPAHNPERWSGRPAIAKSVASAKAMVAAGKGDSRASFTDLNHGKEFSIQAPAKIYLSFFDPNGPAVIPANTSRVKAPLLWVAGSSDPTQSSGPGYAFAKASNPKNKYVAVSADHMGTIGASHATMITWLKDL
jgi:dienelactone hydrolase